MSSWLRKFLMAFPIVAVAFLSVQAEGAPPDKSLKFNTGLEQPCADILNDVMAEACSRIGYNCSLAAYPARRSLIISNTIGDGEAARVRNIKKISPHDTSNLVIVPENTLTLELVVFTKGKDIDVDGWESLKGYRNGARLGARIIEKNLPEERILLAETGSLLKMLDAGRIDTVIEWKEMGLEKVRELDLKGISVTGKPLLKTDFYPFLHKKNGGLSEILAAALASMKSDGTYERIRDDVMRRRGISSAGVGK